MAKYEGFAADGKTTNLDRILAGLAGNSVGTQAMKESVKGYFGYSDSEAAAMIAARSRNGSISAALDGFSRYGIDVSKLGNSSIRSLLATEYGTHEDRLKQARYLQGLAGTQALKKDERAQLDSALAAPGADDGKLKEALVKLSSTRDMEKNAGDQSRESLANIDNATADLATKLIPLTSSIRDGIAWLAKKAGYVDKFGNSESAKAERDTALGAMPASNEEGRVNRLKAELNEVNRNPEKYTQEYRDQIAKAYSDEAARVPQAVAAGGNSASPDVTRPIAANKADFLAKTRVGAEASAAAIQAEGYSTRAEWLQAQLGLETGWGAHVLPGTNNVGNIKADRNWKGKRATFAVREYDRVTGEVRRVNQDFRVYDSLEEGIKDYGRLLKNSGQYLPVREARTADQFASALGRSGYATDPEYGRKIRATIASMDDAKAPALPAEIVNSQRAAEAKARAEYAKAGASERRAIEATVGRDVLVPPGDKFGMMQLPAGARSAGSASTPQGFHFQGTFSLKDQKTGRDMADPLLFSHMAAPRPAGARD